MQHLQRIAHSYDQAILGTQGPDPYKNLPEHITNDPAYPQWQAVSDAGSSCEAIKTFLSPGEHMNFVDLGCAANLIIRGYDAWPSLYHGVDISPETIALLQRFAKKQKRKLTIGTLLCASAHETPFNDNYFDIGACIGMLEYFDHGFVARVIVEAHRILKPGGRLALDIPNISDPVCGIMMKIEAHLGRPAQFDLTTQAFEALLANYFKIDHAQSEGSGMVLYLLSRI